MTEKRSEFDSTNSLANGGQAGNVNEGSRMSVKKQRDERWRGAGRGLGLEMERWRGPW